MFLSLIQIVQCGQITSYNSIKPCTEKHVPNVPGTFLGAFTKLKKVTISFVMSVHPSVCPHGETRLPMDRFS